MSLAVNYLEEYGVIKRRLMTERLLGSSCKAWHPPPSSFVKANIDVALFADSKEMGFVIVLHNEWGRHLFSRTHVMPGTYLPEEGEAIGLHEALSWIKDLGISRVIIEMDAKIVVDTVNEVISPNSILGDIVDGCKRALLNSPNFSVRWIPRDANVTAHRLARSARSFSSPHYWVERPTCVDGLPDISCTC